MCVCVCKPIDHHCKQMSLIQQNRREEENEEEPFKITVGYKFPHPIGMVNDQLFVSQPQLSNLLFSTDIYFFNRRLFELIVTGRFPFHQVDLGALFHSKRSALKWIFDTSRRKNLIYYSNWSSSIHPSSTLIILYHSRWSKIQLEYNCLYLKVWKIRIMNRPLKAITNAIRQKHTHVLI